MAENQDNGNAGTQEPSEAELNQDIKLPEGIDPDNATPEQVRELLKTSQTALAQKKHWRNKAIDPETGKPYKDLVTKAPEDLAPKPKPAEAMPEAESRIARLEQAEEKRHFGHVHNLTPEETDQVYAYATGAGLKASEALEKPFIKNALEAMRSEARANDATPGPSSRSPIVEGKTFHDMTIEEKRKNFPQVVKALKNRAGK